MFILAGVDAGEICSKVDPQLFRIVGTIITAIQIGVPLLLIIFGMLDLGKAVMAQKEDEIKKGQQTFIKRLLAAAIVFFVIFIVKLVFNIVSADTGVWNCIERFITGK